MNYLFVLLLMFLLTSCARSPKHSSEQSASNNVVVGGGCDGCELMYVGMPENLISTDTSKGWNQNGRKLVVSGTVYNIDGKTPASGIILYYWQTDDGGLYSASKELDDRVRRHGDIRGWVKTGPDGRYALYTIRPGAYPGSQNPEHIHLSVKEPGINEYYIDEFVFDDDPFLTSAVRKRNQNRGGSGILKTTSADGIQRAIHDIILGMNIPNYPKR